MMKFSPCPGLAWLGQYRDVLPDRDSTDLFPIKVPDFLGHLSHLGGRGPGPLPALILRLIRANWTSLCPLATHSLSASYLELGSALQSEIDDIYRSVGCPVYQPSYIITLVLGLACHPCHPCHVEQNNRPSDQPAKSEKTRTATKQCC